MPELPEVETVRIQLLAKVVGKTIKGVEVFHNKTVDHDETIEERLIGKTIANIDRVGKLLIFSFKKENDLFLLSHLKMTGQYFFSEKEGEIIGGGHSASTKDWQDLPNKHTRLAFYFRDGSVLYFNDMRLFGYAKLADAKALAKAKDRFGPEPIATDFDIAWFVDSVRKRKAPIKAVLLDQKFIAGLGNIYVDEALWRSKIKPTRRADKLTKREAAALGVAAGEVMKEAIAVGGTTFQHFVDTDGSVGNFTSQLQVFGKQGGKCSRCGAIIKKIRLAGRGTHYCPKCQK